LVSLPPASSVVTAAMTVAVVLGCLAAVSVARGACPAEVGSGCLSQPLVLLQTRQKLDKLVSEGGKLHLRTETSNGVLIPPHVAPPHVALAEARAQHSRVVQKQWQNRQQSLVGNSPMSISAVDWEAFRLLKELRAAGFTCPGGQQFPPNDSEMEFDCRLWQAAMGHSQDMGRRNYLAHVSPDGEDPDDRSGRYGLHTVSETIAAATADAASTLEQWKESSEHCVTMMDAGYNRVAVAHAYVASSTYKHYWTQVFASDDGVAQGSCYDSQTYASDGFSDSDNDSGDGSSEEDSDDTIACEDAETACTDWAGLGYCGAGNDYEPWMRSNCKLSCGLCSTSDTSTSIAPTGDTSDDSGDGRTSEICEDLGTHCRQWASLGFCQEGSQYASIMKENCKASCGECTSDGSSSIHDNSQSSDNIQIDSGGVCQDSESNCPQWAGAGYCKDTSTFAPYMRNNCKLSCGVCD